jgi:hypothetical protein
MYSQEEGWRTILSGLFCDWNMTSVPNCALMMMIQFSSSFIYVLNSIAQRKIEN